MMMMMMMMTKKMMMKTTMMTVPADLWIILLDQSLGHRILPTTLLILPMM